MIRARGLHRSVSVALLSALLVCACDGSETSAASPTLGLSVWQFPGSWQRAGGGELELAALRGRPALLLLFYGTCDSACPTLVHDLQTVEAKLEPTARERLRVVLVTIDPERDTVERLLEYAREKQLDPARWLLLRGSPDQVSELAAAIGFRYRATGNGQFSHTMRITLLDREGVEREHWDGLARPVDPIVRAVNAAAAPH